MTPGALTPLESSLVDLGQRLADAEHWRFPSQDAALDRVVDVVLARLLERIYPSPGVAMLEREMSWLSHEDIAEMTAPDLADERARLRLRLMLDKKPDDWLLQRLTRIESRQAALRQRQR